MAGTGEIEREMRERT